MLPRNQTLLVALPPQAGAAASDQAPGEKSESDICRCPLDTQQNF